MAAGFEMLVVKAGLPGVEQARAELNAGLARARTAGISVLKIVHGYGSSGMGGALRDAIRSSLRKRRKEGTIRLMVLGEQWSIFDEGARQILAECEALSADPDLNRYNEGITFVLL